MQPILKLRSRFWPGLRGAGQNIFEYQDPVSRSVPSKWVVRKVALFVIQRCFKINSVIPFK